MRLVPVVFATHRQYGIFTSGYTLMHLAIGLDFILGGDARHASAGWDPLREAGGFTVWGAAHLAVAAAFAAGLYVSWAWARRAFIASFAVLLFQGFLHLASTRQPGVSFTGAIAFLFLALYASAGLFEREDRRDNKWRPGDPDRRTQ